MTRNYYIDEHKKYLKSIKELNVEQQMELFYKKFGIKISKWALYKLKERWGLTNHPLEFQYTEEQKEYLKQLIPGHNNKYVVDKFYQKYDIKLKSKDITNFKTAHKIISNINNWQIGEERQSGNVCPYIRIKIGKHKYAYKQRVLYEKYNKRKLNGNEVVIFLDNNINNFKKKNLKAIKREKACILDTNNLKFNNNYLTKIGLMITDLQYKTKVKKEENKVYHLFD